MADPPELRTFATVNLLTFVLGFVLIGLSYYAYHDDGGSRSFRNATVGFGLLTLGMAVAPVYQLGIRGVTISVDASCSRSRRWRACSSRPAWGYCSTRSTGTTLAEGERAGTRRDPSRTRATRPAGSRRSPGRERPSGSPTGEAVHYDGSPSPAGSGKNGPGSPCSTTNSVRSSVRSRVASRPAASVADWRAGSSAWV